MSGHGHPHGGTARSLRLLHHFLGAAALASVLLLIEAAGLLRWLDVAMLRTVAPLVGMASREAVPPPGRTAPPPVVVVVIDPQTYADDFGLLSPLPRQPLGTLLQRIATAQPRTVLVDLQLEPAVGERGKRPLDEQLKALARESSVVLPVPEARTQKLDQQALDWMRELCAAGVRFGSAELLAQLGTVVRYKSSPLTLAQQAVLLNKKSKPAPAQQDEHDAHDKSACELAEAAPSLSLLHLELRRELEAHHSTRPLRSAQLRAVERHAISAYRLEREADSLRSQLKDAVVVLGGHYDTRDQFATSAGEMSGVNVHAAAVAEGLDPTTENHLAGWAVDMLLGTALGFLFEFLFHVVHAGSKLLDAVLARRGVTARVAWALHFYGRQCLMLLVWLTPALLTLAFFGTAGWFMGRGWWLNPGPVVLGMFVHVVLLQYAQHHAAPTLRSFISQHPASVLFQIPITVVAPIVYVLLHH